MKRIYIALALLIIAAGVGTIEYIVISLGIDYYTNRLDNAQEMLEQGKYSEAQQVCRDASQQFESFNQNGLYYFYNHNTTREVGENLDRLSEYIRLGKLDDFAVMKNTVKKQLLALKDKEQINLKNVI